MTVCRRQWGEAGGRSVDLYVLSHGPMEAAVATYGGALVRLMVPDAAGRAENVVLGYDSLDGYLRDEQYFGSLVGRTANRVGNARFTLNGAERGLDRNHGRHHLHGGSRGFNTRVWDGEAADTPHGPRLTLRRTSPDGEQGYPGALAVRVDYTLLADGLRLDFFAETDAPTPVNLTGHAYFNLSGRPGSTIEDHRLAIPASRVLETDPDLIPTGGLADVAGTPFDFRRAAAVGARIGEDHPGLRAGAGYDHYFVLDDDSGGLKVAAEVSEPASGRRMTVLSTHPGVQFYSGNHIPPGSAGADGARYSPRSGFCLEAHGYPDAANQAGFPSVTLLPGERMHHTILYNFFAK